MKVIATHHFQAALLWLRRNPVLTVLMVYSLVFSIAALTATYIVCRINSSSPTVHGHGLLYLV
jgi:cell division protein FtsX